MAENHKTVQFGTEVGGEGDSAPSNHLVLFVRAGKDGESYGGCVLCQRMFMILLMKAKAGELTFTVKTVNMSKASVDFKKIASRLPVIMHGSEIISDPDEMIQYIDDNFPYPPMAYDKVKANDACMNVFSKFSFYIKDVSNSSTPLLAELKKLNDYLENAPHKFLCRDVPDHLDCMMLPKLQHIQVVSKAYKDFEIPADLKGLWRYLKTAYDEEVFTRTCPTDQEIVYHWQCKPELPRLDKATMHLYDTEGSPRYSFSVPAGSA